MSTSLVGSYGVVYAAGLVLGDFPDVYSLARQIKFHEFDKVKY